MARTIDEVRELDAFMTREEEEKEHELATVMYVTYQMEQEAEQERAWQMYCGSDLSL